MANNDDSALVPIDQISSSILLLRGYRVILDRDLAAIYGVKTGPLNQAVKRNADRFPADSCSNSLGRRSNFQDHNL